MQILFTHNIEINYIDYKKKIYSDFHKHRFIFISWGHKASAKHHRLWQTNIIYNLPVMNWLTNLSTIRLI